MSTLKVCDVCGVQENDACETTIVNIHIYGLNGCERSGFGYDLCLKCRELLTILINKFGLAFK